MASDLFGTAGFSRVADQMQITLTRSDRRGEIPTEAASSSPPRPKRRPVVMKVGCEMGDDMWSRAELADRW
jgi:hypothetical protein